MDLFRFPEPLRALAEAQLLPGERIVWVGRPSPTRAFFMTSAIWLFAAPWTAISSVFFGSALAGLLGLAEIDGIEGLGGFAFFLFSLPFMGIGLAMLSAPFFAFHEARRSGFIVTDRRVVSLTVNRVRAAKGLTAGALRGAEIRLFSNGRGTVKALGPVGRDSDDDRTTDEIVMSGIEDPQGAERAIWSLVHATRPAA